MVHLTQGVQSRAQVDERGKYAGKQLFFSSGKMYSSGFDLILLNITFLQVCITPFTNPTGALPPTEKSRLPVPFSPDQRSPTGLM